MNNTKTIFKSLLIMIVAISLFTVSCSKDEGGSKPTNPTPTTINAANLLSSIKKIKAYKDRTLLVSFSTVDFSVTAGESTEVTTESGQSTFTEIQSGLKTAFDALANNAVLKVTTNIDNVTKPADAKGVLSVTLTIKPATAYVKFDSDITDGKKFQYQDGAAVLTVKIKPSADWK